MPSWKNARLIFPMRPGCPELRWLGPLGAWAIGAGLLLGGPALSQPALPQVALSHSVPQFGTAAPTSGPYLVLDRRQRLLLVLEGGQERRRFPVGVGRPGWETPVGRFEVIELARNPTW